jgi:hypothetical protein
MVHHVQNENDGLRECAQEREDGVRVALPDFAGDRSVKTLGAGRG